MKIKPNSLTILLSLFLLATLLSCSSKNETSFFDKVKKSSFDGSVEPVVDFLKKKYLRDPDSYNGVEWGELVKNADGTFQISHRFSAKNGFGGMNTETLIFCISEDGKEVHVCTGEDEKRIYEIEKKSQETNANEEYIKNDFENVEFVGVIAERIDGLDEQCTFKGTLSKTQKNIIGNLDAVEKEIKYHLSGTIADEGIVEFKLENLTDGSVVEMSGLITANKFSGQSKIKSLSFYLNQIE